MKKLILLVSFVLVNYLSGNDFVNMSRYQETLLWSHIQPQNSFLNQQILDSQKNGDVDRHNFLEKKRSELEVINIRFHQVLRLISIGLFSNIYFSNIQLPPFYIDRTFSIIERCNELYKMKKFTKEIDMIDKWHEAVIKNS